MYIGRYTFRIPWILSYWTHGISLHGFVSTAPSQCPFDLGSAGSGYKHHWVETALFIGTSSGPPVKCWIIYTWNLQTTSFFFNGCFNWMIPNHYIHKKLLFHQTSIKKWLFRVPGIYQCNSTCLSLFEGYPN